MPPSKIKMVLVTAITFVLSLTRSITLKVDQFLGLGSSQNLAFAGVCHIPDSTTRRRDSSMTFATRSGGDSRSTAAAAA